MLPIQWSSIGKVSVLNSKLVFKLTMLFSYLLIPNDNLCILNINLLNIIRPYLQFKRNKVSEAEN